MFIYVYHALEVYMEPAQIRNISLSLPDFFQVSKRPKNAAKSAKSRKTSKKVKLVTKKTITKSSWGCISLKLS